MPCTIDKQSKYLLHYHIDFSCVVEHSCILCYSLLFVATQRLDFAGEGDVFISSFGLLYLIFPAPYDMHYASLYDKSYCLVFCTLCVTCLHLFYFAKINKKNYCLKEWPCTSPV